MSEFYRPRTVPYGTAGGGSQHTSVRLTEETRRGFEEIRELFRRRFPLEKYPTLSACLEVALRKFLENVGNDPVALKEEVEEFRERYGVPR